MEEDRSALFNQLKNFSQRKLKKVETKVVTPSGEQLVEKRGAKGLQVLTGGGSNGNNNEDSEPPRKLDLQVGLVLPGFLMGSQDVAHDKSSLDSYGITHILSLDSGVENKFEDDFNYKNINIQDRPDFDLDKILEDCFDFIDDGRHYGNVFIHCSGTVGLSRTTTVCIAYLMNKEKQKFDEAFNNVKEARSFVKPNDGFIKQLKDYEVKLRGAQQIKESGIDDPFALRKKQEIEQEKAMVAGASSVKNRMKMFGATLDTGAAGPRSKSVSPSPLKTTSPSPATTTTTTTASKWGANKDSQAAAVADGNKSISKSMTPEPRKSWQQQQQSEPAGNKNDWRSSNTNKSPQISSGGPPPPPPPMPTKSLHDDKPLNSSNSGKISISLPPPPPPQPRADLYSSPSSQNKSPSSFNSNNNNNNSYNRKDSEDERKVFGRVPPPPMKIKGGLSIERQDSVSERNLKNSNNSQGDLLMGQTIDINQRCASPLVLFNNVPPKFSNQAHDGRQSITSRRPGNLSGGYHGSNDNQLPKRTVSLGPRREPPPRLRMPHHAPRIPDASPREADENFPRRQGTVLNRADSFNKMAKELQSSLTELNNLIDSTPTTPRITTPASNRPPKYSSYITSTIEPPTPTLARSEHTGNQHHPLDLEDDDEQPHPSRLSWRESDERSNWKPSTSMNDLRSMFDPKLQSSLPAASPSPNPSRPPLSASPSVFATRTSPWQSKTPSSNTVQSLTGSDGSIRRTTSTISRSNIVLRNPYRTQYEHR